MTNRTDIDGITWIDIESPSGEELDTVCAEYGVDPFVREELALPTLHPFVTQFPTYLYTILHFPVAEQSHSKPGHQEIDFVIGKNFLITVRYDMVDSLHHLRKMLETEAILNRTPNLSHAGELFVHMITRLYKGVSDELKHQTSRIAHIEQHIFDGKEKDMLFDISRTAQTLLSFRQAIQNHREPLESFLVEGVDFFGKKFTLFAQSILGEQHRISQQIIGHIETVRELRETNNSLLTTKQNDITRVLTVVAFTALPATLIATIFAMEVKGNPLADHPYDFWIIISIMIATSGIFFLISLIKRWL